MGTIVVTGVNGFVGRHVLGSLIGKKISAVGLDMQELSPFSHNGFSYFRADIRERSSIETISSFKPDVIIHLAGLLSKADDPSVHSDLVDANVVGTMHVLEAARECGSKIVFSSSGLVYGDRNGPFTEDMACSPGDFYGYSKLAAEELIRLFHRRYGIPFTILRAAVLYGPNQGGSMFIPSLLKSLVMHEKFPMTAGEQTRDFIYIDDFVSALLLASLSDLDGVYNVGTGTPTSMKEAAALAEDLAGAKGLLQFGALPYRVNETWHYALSPEKLVRETGWTPRTGLREGMEKILHNDITLQKRVDKV
ncbi:MAG: NAD-dependent epimerase/dehydratase family protein [Chitinispirillaceae bacterium]